MKRWRWIFGLTMTTAWLLTAAPASATLVEHLDTDQMFELATVVVVGEVKSVESSWDERRTKILTRVTVAVEEVIKGDRTLRSVTVVQIGGTVGDVDAQLPGAPSFAAGERVLLFLEKRRTHQGYLVLGLFQGKFQLKDGKGGEDALLERRVPDGVMIIDTPKRPASSKPLTLADVRRMVKGAVR